MRKFVLLTIVLLLWTAAPAAAQSTLSDPGGPFTASGGPAIMTAGGAAEVSCDWLVLHGIAPVGPSGNPLAVFPEFPGAEFSGCTNLATFTQVGTWEMNGASSDSDTITGTIDNVEVDLAAPGCVASFRGFLNFVYSQMSGQLEILADATLIASVDPVNDCLGLISSGEHASMSVDLSVDPIQHF